MYWKGMDLLFRSGLASPVLNKASGSRVLLYHNITEEGSRKFNSRFISAAEFEQQLIEMKKHWNIFPLENIMEGTHERDRMSVALTFDDGLANNLYTVLPLLEKHKVPATFFVCSAPAEGTDILWTDLLDLVSVHYTQPISLEKEKFVNRNGRYYSVQSGLSLQEYCLSRRKSYTLEMKKSFPSHAMKFRDDKNLEPYWKLMNGEEILKLSTSPWVTIGSHGHSHCSLVHVSAEEAEAELKSSRQWLEQLTGKKTDLFAYPFGHYTGELVNLAESCGYRKQLLINYSINADAKDKRLFTRMGNNPYISWKSQLHAYTRGKYQ